MLISPEMIEENKRLFQIHEPYATSGGKWRDLVRPWAAWGRKPILDYGAGRETLKLALGPAYKVTSYDPCVVGLDTPPVPHDIVYCGDVLEHVEPDLLDAVLADLRRLTKETLIAVIALTPSTQTLSDGRNAHLILKPPQWWVDQIAKAGFEIKQVKPAERTRNTTWVIATPEKVQ